MARSINRVTLFGYTADEPVVRQFSQDSKVANITVVTNENSRNAQTGQWEEIPEWHRVVAWGRLADVLANYVHKGQRLYVEGRLRTHSYTDNAGVKRKTTEIIANEIIFGDSRRDAGAGMEPRDMNRNFGGGSDIYYGSQGGGSFGNQGGGSYGNQGGTSYNGQSGSYKPQGDMRRSNDFSSPNRDFGSSGPYGEMTQNSAPSNSGVYGASDMPQEPPYQGANNIYKPQGTSFDSGVEKNIYEPQSKPVPPAPPAQPMAQAAPVAQSDGDDDIPF